MLLGSIAIALGWIRFTVWIEPQSPDTSSLPVMKPPRELIRETPEAALPILPTRSPISPTPDALPPKSLDPKVLAAAKGVLRVSNPTEHPVRLALLEQPSSGKSYGKPAHWDFAPMEGGSQGLILSLPQDQLKVKKGDILVAFAQDGSRLYWGPYIVGETALPIWNSQKAEWQLILQRSP